MLERIFSKSIAAAVEILNRKDLVALPTETVYGLAGDALEPETVVKIFEAKDRPLFDPLIIHRREQEVARQAYSLFRKVETRSANADGTILAGTVNDPISQIRSSA